jgi:hypothetical protein
MMPIQNIIQRIADNKKALGITLYAPATRYEIEMVEKSMNISFPDELKEFYLFCNGFESEEDMFRVVPLDEMQHIYKPPRKNQICIAEYLVYCDYWELTIDVKDSSFTISNGVVLTNSLTEFLDHFLTGGVFEPNGLYDWKNSIMARSTFK